MDVNWAQRQIVHYADDARRLLRRLRDDSENDAFFLRHALDLLRTYLEIPTHERTDRRCNEVMVELAQFLYPLVYSQGYREYISQLWPKLLVVAEQVADPNVKVTIATQLAIDKSNRGKIGEAVTHYEELLAGPDFIHIAPGHQTVILHQIGLCYLYQGKYTKAKVNFQRSLEIADTHVPQEESVGDLDEEVDRIYRHIQATPPAWPYQAFSLNHLGNIALYHGDDSGARSYYEQTLALLQANGAENTYACVPYQSLGRLFVLRRQFAEAIPMAERAITNLYHFNDRQHIATNLTYLAAAYIGLGRDKEAEDLLTAALQTCHELNDPLGTALCHIYFGHLESVRGDDGDAIVQWQQALDFLSDGTMMAIELQVLVNLLPKLLRARRYRRFGLSFIRLMRNIRAQKLSMVALWRVLRLYKLPQVQRHPLSVPTIHLG